MSIKRKFARFNNIQIYIYSNLICSRSNLNQTTFVKRHLLPFRRLFTPMLAVSLTLMAEDYYYCKAKMVYEGKNVYLRRSCPLQAACNRLSPEDYVQFYKD